MRKNWYIIIDTESTITDKCADFGAIVCDKHGNIATQCAVLIKDFRDHSLFYDAKSKDEIWTIKGLERRQANYERMLESGERMIASVAAVNRWLDKVNREYSPTLSAYNIAFDTGILNNSGIAHSQFIDRFCLWQAAIGQWSQTSKFKNFVLEHNAFNNVTAKNNMTYKTNAEIMASFVAGEMLPPEPHTALEDALLYEMPILLALLKKRDWRKKVKPYNWREHQVNRHFRSL